MKMVTTRGLFNKSTLIITAFVIVFGSIAAALPVMLSKRAAAAPVYTEIPFSSSELTTNWSTDRQTPSGGYSSTSFASRSDVLQLNIDTTAASQQSFYRTEGIGRQITASSSIKADVYVDSEWYSRDVRAGLWGVARDGNDDISAYPIVEFVSGNVPNNNGYSGWRTYNTETGAWVNLYTEYVPNAWNTLEITLNQTTDKFEYRINGSLVDQVPGNGSSTIGAAIINSYNNANNENSYNYSARWSKFSIGSEAPAVLAAPANLRLNGDQACGYTTNVNYITPTWDAVDGAVSYNYQVTIPSGAVYGPVNVGNVISVSGAFGGEGLSTFSVQAVGANGLTSAWAPACSVTYDATAPETPVHVSPSQNAVINFNDFYFDWTDASGAVRYEMQNSTNPAVDANGSFQNVMWTGDYQQIQPTESKARSVGASGTWYWQVRAVDAAGNKSAWTTPWAITIDTVAPAAPVLAANTPGGTAMQNGGLTNSYEVVADWNDVDGASSYIYKYWNSIPGNPYTSANPYTVDGLGTSQTAGVFNQGEGTHFMQVFAVDAAGNVSQGSNVFEITYDTTAPVVLGDTYSTQDNVITPNFSVDDPSATLVWQQVSGPDGGAVPSSTNVVAPNFTVNTDGEYSFRLTATDGAGNQVNKLFNFNFVTPPAQTPVTSPEVLGSDTEADGPTTPAVPAVTTFAATPTIVGPGFTNVAVLGEDVATQNTATQDDSEVEGASTLNSPAQAVNSDANQGNFLGLAWYWWLLILAAITGIAWWIIAALRNRQAQN